MCKISCENYYLKYVWKTMLLREVILFLLETTSNMLIIREQNYNASAIS